MQALGLLGSAFASILNPASILLMIAGVAIGIIFGLFMALTFSIMIISTPMTQIQEKEKKLKKGIKEELSRFLTNYIQKNPHLEKQKVHRYQKPQHLLWLF